ncbi:ion channel [Marinospirillum sp.]|uniref:ion channel n=1 Tax=Marinospirillum sp. TaxID=2183934 RepID=UPI00385031F8
MILTPEHFQAALITLIVVVFSVLLHFEAILLISQMLKKLRLTRRPRFILMIMGLLMAHVLEIWVFGAAGWWMVRMGDMGQLVGYTDLEFLDYIYLSAASFTTVGFGDLAPQGMIRMLFGTESLTGFLLITWSASFTYIEMERHWKSLD